MRLWEVQTAIKTRLDAYAPLTAVVSDIYDEVPASATFPYVVLGEVTTVPFDTADSTGEEQTFTIHVWSEYRGRKEVRQIQEHIYDALNRYDLSVGANMVDCTQEYSEDFIDTDGIRRHGVQRFRIYVDG